MITRVGGLVGYLREESRKILTYIRDPKRKWKMPYTSKSIGAD